MIKYRVREARIDDIRHMVTLAYELLDSSYYAGIPGDETKFKRTVAALIGSRMGCVLVAVDHMDVPVGFLLGVVDELFFSRKKYASDLCTYVREEASPYVGAFLIARFVRWAKKVPGVVEITMGVSSGMGDVERTGEIYERIGMGRVGGLFTMRVDKVADESDKVVNGAAVTPGG